ncbi:MAG TPA: DUF4270 family protein [Chitinophagaceae bacterium]|nr:DUF4270 family protein [Chitinophagaceae bacterium]
MKNSNPALSFLAIITSVAILFSACKKLNESTELGGGLIPPVDNINTFETYLDVITDNKLFKDTTKVYYGDNLALGHIANDPEFGGTHANAYFNIGSPYFSGTSANSYYPFINKDSVIIDSVILSLSYTGYYGDTNSIETIHVFEIAQNPGFSDTTLYKYDTTDFQTVVPELGSKTFQVKALKDSILHIRKKDTTKLANVIRIPLQNQLGVRLASYDTSNTSNGGFRNDSIFKTLFKGLAIKADNSGNALTYISPADQSKTKLTVYFRVTKNGVKDTLLTDFYHQTHGQANVITRFQSNGWLSYLNNGLPSDDKVYLQSVPGSYASIKIPALDTFKNAVIHRAELVLNPLPSAQEAIFVQPLGLFLDRINANGDTASAFDTDMDLQPSGLDFTYNFSYFGGGLKSDSTYRFNVSKYVQDIITLKKPNQTLRLYAPVRAFVYSTRFARISQIYVTTEPAYGRVVLGGGNYAVPGKRLRLRVIYSKL